MKVLITGIGGLLGGRFAHWLQVNQPDIEIVGLDDFSCGYEENVPEGIKVIHYTLGQGRLQYEYYDYIFHFAAHAAECLSPFIRVFNYQNNLLGTAEVVNMAIQKGTKRLIFTSSIAVYGAGKPPFDECDVYTFPTDPYGNAKLACERDIEIAADQHGLEYCILRPHNVYGIGQDLWNTYRNVIGIWMAQKLTGKSFTIFGDGKQRRAMSFIGDNLPCFWQAAVSELAKNEIINLGGECPITINELCELMQKIVGGNSIEYLPPRHEVHDAWCTVEKSKILLGYKEKVCLEDGITRMWDWAQTNRQRVNKNYKYEITKAMYECWK